MAMSSAWKKAAYKLADQIEKWIEENRAQLAEAAAKKKAAASAPSAAPPAAAAAPPPLPEKP